MKKITCKHIYQFYVIPGYSKEINVGSYGMERDYANRYETQYINAQVKAKCIKCLKTKEIQEEVGEE